MAKAKVEYWSRSSPTYDISMDASLGGNTRPLVNELLKREENLGAVIEFGCGTGYFTKTLARRAESVVATDFSDDMLRIAEEHLTGFSNVRFRNVDCQHTPFADTSFDTVFAGFVIPCVDDNVQVLRESCRILKPGGRLIVANPNILLLSGPGKIRFVLRALVAWRGRLPPVRFCPVRDLIGGTGFILADLKVVQDPAVASGAPVEYVTLVKA
jgi:ABC-2 type transport system ATP-binding protein